MNFLQKLDIKKKLKTLKIKDIKELIELSQLELVRRDKQIKRYK